MNRLFATIRNSQLWRLLTQPLSETLGELDNRRSLVHLLDNYDLERRHGWELSERNTQLYTILQEYKRRYREMDVENAELRRRIRLYNNGDTYNARTGISWKFDCMGCRGGIHQSPEPATRWIDGENKLLCAVCAEHIPQYVEGATQRRPLRGEAA